MEYWRPKDQHAKALIDEAEAVWDEYSPEALEGLLQDLCAEIKRAHMRIEHVEKGKCCDLKPVTDEGVDKEMILSGNANIYKCICGQQYLLPADKVITMRCVP